MQHFVGFHISGLLQSRRVASTSYVLRVRVASAEHFAETLNRDVRALWRGVSQRTYHNVTCRVTVFRSLADPGAPPPAQIQLVASPPEQVQRVDMSLVHVVSSLEHLTDLGMGHMTRSSKYESQVRTRAIACGSVWIQGACDHCTLYPVMACSLLNGLFG